MKEIAVLNVVQTKERKEKKEDEWVMGWARAVSSNVK